MEWPREVNCTVLRWVAGVHCVHYIREKDCSARFATGAIWEIQVTPATQAVLYRQGPLYVAYFLNGRAPFVVLTLLYVLDQWTLYALCTQCCIQSVRNHFVNNLTRESSRPLHIEKKRLNVCRPAGRCTHIKKTVWGSSDRPQQYVSSLESTHIKMHKNTANVCS